MGEFGFHKKQTIKRVKQKYHPSLGQWMWVEAILLRDYDHDNERRPREAKATWKREKIEPKVNAMFIGWRTLASGLYVPGHGGNSEDYEPAYLVTNLYQEAWLFVSDARQKPFLVSPLDTNAPDRLWQIVDGVEFHNVKAE